MIGPSGTQTGTRSIIEPQTATFGLLLWHFQPFPSPDPIDALNSDAPALVDEKLAHTPVAIATVVLASRTTAAVSAASSSRILGLRRCVARDCPTTEHARRSETGTCDRT
jgi:hypothetical protein